MTKKSAEQVNLSLISRCTPGRNQQQPRFRSNGAWTAEGMNTLGVVPSLSLYPKVIGPATGTQIKSILSLHFFLLARKKRKKNVL